MSGVSGDVILTHAECERAALESVSGDIRYSGTFAKGGRYEFRTHSGDVFIYIANDVGFELEAETFSGDIESEFPLTMSDTNSKREVNGVYGDGSALIEASTFSGSVTISKERAVGRATKRDTRKRGCHQSTWPGVGPRRRGPFSISRRLDFAPSRHRCAYSDRPRGAYARPGPHRRQGPDRWCAPRSTSR